MLEEIVQQIEKFFKNNEPKISGVNSAFRSIRESIKLIHLSSNIGGIYVITATILFIIGTAILYNEVVAKIKFDEATKKVTQALISKEHEPRKTNKFPGVLSALLYDQEKVSAYEQSVTSSIDQKLKNISTVSLSGSFSPLKYGSFKIIPTDSKIFQNQGLIFVEQGMTDNPKGILIPPSEINQNENYQGSTNIEAFRRTLQTFTKETIKNILTTEYQSISKHLNYDNFEAFAYSTNIFSEAYLNILSDTFPQLFFISPGGIFAHTVDQSESPELLNVAKKIPMYRWEASSYIQKYFNPDTPSSINWRTEPQKSKLYLDIAGLGIVRTWTIPMIVEGDEKKVVGIICLDEKVSIRDLINKEEIIIDDSVKNSEFGITAWSNGVYDYAAVRVRTYNEDESRKRRMLKKYVQEKFSQVPFSFSVLEDGITTDIDEGNFYGLEGNREISAVTEDVSKVRLSKGKNEFVVVYIAISQASAGTIFSTKLILGILLIISSIFLMTVGHYRKVEQNENAILANILRNLPTGIMELNYESVIDNDSFKGEIRFANDAAEEIFLRELPRFGDKDNPMAKKVVFEDLVDPDTIMIKDEDGKYKNINVLDLTKKRTSGEATTYFVKLNEKKMVGLAEEKYLKNSSSIVENKDSEIWPDSHWLKVTGSPIIEEGKIRTFGLVSRELNSAKIKKIEDAMNPKETQKTGDNND